MCAIWLQLLKGMQILFKILFSIDCLMLGCLGYGSLVTFTQTKVGSWPSRVLEFETS